MNYGALLVLSLGLMLISCRKASPGTPVEPSLAAARRIGNRIQFSPNDPQLRRIRVETVQSAPVPEDEVVAPGKVELDPSRVSRVPVPVSGRILRVLVGLGDTVKAGDPVLFLESTEVSGIVSALRQALANLTQAQATLGKSEADFNRARDLLADHAIAQKEVLAASAAVVQAKSGVEQAQAARDEAMRRLQILGVQPDAPDQQITVKARVPGRVVEINAAAGDFRNDTTTPVMTIADVSIVWVSADVPEDRIRLIRIGEPVEISMPAFPGERLKGRVRRIADTVDPQTRTIKVRAEMPNPAARFRSEMFATVRYVRGTSVLPVIPRGAVLQQENANTVFVERARGEFEEVSVTVAWQDEKRAAIRSGIRAGECVVVEGNTQLNAY